MKEEKLQGNWVEKHNVFLKDFDYNLRKVDKSFKRKFYAILGKDFLLFPCLVPWKKNN